MENKATAGIFAQLTRSVLVCAAVCTSHIAFGQPMIVGETRVLEGHDSPRPYEPAPEPGGTVTTIEIDRPGARFLKLLFADFGLAPDDYVIVRDPDSHEVYRYDSNAPERFWAMSVSSDRVIVELISRSNEGGAGFRIAGYGQNNDDFLWGGCENQWEPDIQTCTYSEGDCGCLPCRDCCGCQYPPHYGQCESPWSAPCCGIDVECLAESPIPYNLRRPVNALLIPDTDEPPGMLMQCTGYQVAYDKTGAGWVLSNMHCKPSFIPWSAVEIWFNVERADCGKKGLKRVDKYTVQFVCGDGNSWDDAELDYALLKINAAGDAPPASEWGKLRLRSVPTQVGEPVHRFHHSQGCEKKYTSGQISNDASENWTHLPADGFFVYDACGAGGSSGSPVIGAVDNCVVVHHRSLLASYGINIPKICTPGRGTSLSLIIDDMIAKGCLPENVSMCTGEPCLGDLNGDGVVDVFDLLIVLVEWGPCADPNDCLGDLNGDGVVDVFDLLIVLAEWGPCYMEAELPDGVQECFDLYGHDEERLKHCLENLD